MTIRRIFFALIMTSLLFTPAHAQYRNYLKEAYPDYRTEDTYRVSGMNLTILSEERWGSIVYAPGYSGNIRLEKEIIDTVLKTGYGDVRINKDISGIYTISYPKGKAVIEPGFGEYNVTFKKEHYRFSYDGTLGLSRNSAILEMPGDTIEFRREFNEFTISGSQREVKYKDALEGYIVESSAGSTKYVRNLDGGYSIEGVSADRHPYRYWGILFYLERYDVGIIIDFFKLITFIPTPKILEFKNAIVIY